MTRWFVAAVVAAGGVAVAPVAYAEPGVDDVICGALALGETPGQVAEQLHQGDGRISTWQGGQLVRDALRSC